MEVMNAHELSDYLKIAYSTINQQAARGEIPHARIGRKRVFRKSTIDTWLTEQELHSMEVV